MCLYMKNGKLNWTKTNGAEETCNHEDPWRCWHWLATSWWNWGWSSISMQVGMDRHIQMKDGDVDPNTWLVWICPLAMEKFQAWWMIKDGRTIEETTTGNTRGYDVSNAGTGSNIYNWAKNNQERNIWITSNSLNYRFGIVPSDMDSRITFFF